MNRFATRKRSAIDPQAFGVRHHRLSTRAGELDRSMDRQLLVHNIVGAAKAAVAYGLPIVHSTVNVKTGLNKLPIAQLRKVLDKFPTYDRTSINSWKTWNFERPWKARAAKTHHDGALDRSLPDLSCPDAMAAGYEVYVVADAVGDVRHCHEMALRRIEQAGGK